MARTERGPIMVPFTVPGDVAAVRMRGRRGGITIGALESIVTPSRDRVAPPCPYAGRCGGCPWQMFDYGAQLRLKHEEVQVALRGLPIPEIPPVVPSPRTLGYRNRMDYVFGPNGELGLREPGSWKHVLDLETCLLLSEDAVRVMGVVRAWMQEHRIAPWDARTHQGFLRYLVIREGKRTGERMVILITAPGEFSAREHLLQQLKPYVTSVVHGSNATLGDTSTAQELRALYGDDFLHERLNLDRSSFSFSIPPLSFFQTNTDMAEQLLATVREFAALSPSDTLVDLYCGIGLFSLSLARDAGSVIGVESDAPAIAAARQNATVHEAMNARFIAQTSEAWPFPFDPVACVVVDPPRAGLHPRVRKKLLTFRPPRIIYVSCNPQALARDLKELLSQYTCDAIRCLDLFPHTPHVETVVRLQWLAR